jgi:putative ABC transport system permease protein
LLGRALRPAEIVGVQRDVRNVNLAADRDQPVTAIQTMDELFETAAAQPRFTTFLLGLLAATAMLLAVVGIYGVISCVVGERTQEMRVRIALGAESGEILGLVLRHALLLTGIGVAIGIAPSLAVTRSMAGLLYHVSATDPLTFALVALTFIAVVLAAGYVPARRAIRVDPVVTLRG